jgi:hypothetical protein
VTRKSLACWALATLALASIARADVYKCAGEGGSPIYQEMPCAKGRELRNFQTDPPEITILPAIPRTGAPADKGAVPAETKAAKDAKAAKDVRPGKSAQAGDASERKFLRTGMSEADVLSKLGPPDMTTGARNSGVARWTYMPAPGDPETITSMTITKGTVTDIERKAVRK